MTKLFGSLLLLATGVAALGSSALSAAGTPTAPSAVPEPVSAFERVSSEVQVTEFDPSTGQPQTLVMTADHQHAALVVHADSKFQVMTDGKSSQPFDDVIDLQFSPDGKHLAFIARLGKEMFAVVDQRKEQSYDRIIHGSLIYSPNGERVAYIAQFGKEQAVVTDTEVGKHYESIMPDSLVFSMDGKQLAYVARSGQKAFLVADGAEGMPYDAIFNVKPLAVADSATGLGVRYGALLGNQVFYVEERVK